MQQSGNIHTHQKYGAWALNLITTVTALVLLASGVSGRGAPGHNPAGYPTESKPFGKSYAEWSAAFWQWGMGLPAEGHPFVGCPASCDEGQSGPVWFLGGGATECECTVPLGKAIFFPLANAEASDLEGLGSSAADQAEAAAFLADHIIPSSLFCVVDGVALENLTAYRFVSPQFTFSAPSPWIYGDTGGTGTAVGDGYYIFLKPLSAGWHTIRFGGTFDFSIANGDPFDFHLEIDTTYHLKVE